MILTKRHIFPLSKVIFRPMIGLGCLLIAHAQDASPVQSAARPYNLDIIAPVEVAGSDAASLNFQTNVLPGLLATERSTIGYQTHTEANLATISSGASELTLSGDSSVRVYFLGEKAAYLNTLGFSTTGGSPLSPGAALIFPNASDPLSLGGSGSPIRTATDPLLPGDFVNLGNFKAGTSLDFFLIAYGASGGKFFSSTNLSMNQDGLVHTVTMATDGSPYLIVSFEDQKGGGDRSFNDVYFAVDITPSLSSAIVSLGAPEPSLAVGTLLTGCALLGARRRQRRDPLSLI